MFVSATEAKVPARGKALVQTDLSIGIPEGTYARIGMPIVLCLLLSCCCLVAEKI